MNNSQRTPVFKKSRTSDDFLEFVNVVIAYTNYPASFQTSGDNGESTTSRVPAVHQHKWVRMDLLFY